MRVPKHGPDTRHVLLDAHAPDPRSCLRISNPKLTHIPSNVGPRNPTQRLSPEVLLQRSPTGCERLGGTGRRNRAGGVCSRLAREHFIFPAAPTDEVLSVGRNRRPDVTLTWWHEVDYGRLYQDAEFDAWVERLETRVISHVVVGLRRGPVRLQHPSRLTTRRI